MVNPLPLIELGLANITMIPFAYYFAKIKFSKPQSLQTPEEIPQSKILILLPIWNEQTVIKSKLDNLKQEVQSVNAESGNEISILIVDSASTDKSVEFCKNWLRENSEIFQEHQIIQMDERKGKSAAVKLALELVNTASEDYELVFMTDADAILEDGCLLNLLRWFSIDSIGAVGATPNRKRGLSSETVHRDMFSMLRDYESRVGSTSMLEGSAMIWRSNLLKTDDIMIDSNADDAQIATSIFLTGSRVIQAPDAKFIDYAPSKRSQQFRQKKRRGQGLIRNFLNSNKKVNSSSSLDLKSKRNYKLNHFFHVKAPWFSLGFLLASALRHGVAVVQSDYSSIWSDLPSKITTIVEATLLSSIILLNFGLRVPLLSALGSFSAGMHALISAWVSILLGKTSNLWDQHTETRVNR